MFCLSQWIARFSTVVLLAGVAACGGGGGGGSGTNTSGGSTPPPGPLIESFVSMDVLEDVWGITPSGSRLFLSTWDGLVELNSTNGEKRTVAGNNNIHPGFPGTEEPQLNFTGVVSGNDAYVRLNYYGRLAKTSTGADGTTAIDQIVPHQKATNFDALAANSSHTFFSGRAASTVEVFSQAHGQPGSSTPLLNLAGWHGQMVATDDYLYVYVDGGGPAPNNFRRLYRHTISTGLTTLLYDAPRLGAYITLIVPLAADAAGVYWANGQSLFRAAHGDIAGTFVTTLADFIVEIVPDSSGLFVHHIENYTIATPSPSTRDVVTRVTTGPISTTELMRLVHDNVAALAYGVSGNDLYVALDAYDGTRWRTRLYRRNSSSGLDPLLNADDLYGMLGVQGLLVVNGKVVFSGGDSYGLEGKLLIYDIATLAVSELHPMSRVGHMKRSGNYVYMAGSSATAIARLDLSKPYRAVDAINVWDPIGGFAPIGGTQAGGYLYFYGKYGSGGGNSWQLVRMRPDGSEYQTLHTSTGELRDPVVIGSTVYFLCLDDCGAPGWVLASIDVTGGPINPEYMMPFGPRLYGRNSYLYATGTFDGVHGGIYAIDIVGGTDAIVVDNLNYTAVTLAFTDTWLYWAGSNVSSGGAPARAIQRHPWVSWNSVGQATQIVGGVAAEVDQLFEWTIATDANYLYYWHAGLKRVAH